MSAIDTSEQTVRAAARRPRLLSRMRRLTIVERIALGWLVLVVGAAALAPLLPLQDRFFQDFRSLADGPSWGHPLGTDANGRDLLARTVWGARVSLLLGLLAVGGGMVVGGAIGIAAGYLRGTFEQVVLVLVDALLSIPALVLLMAMTVVFGRNFGTLTVGLMIITIPAFTRLARAQSLTVSERPFVLAARVLGVRRRRILGVEIMPNVVPALAAYAVLLLALVIVAEGSLSFLGVGIPPPNPSWGSMIAAGRVELETAPHIAFVPAATMFVSVLSIYVLGERLQQRLQFRESNV